MRLAIISDIHGSLSFLPGATQSLVQADVVVIAGDITTFGDVKAARSLVQSIRAINSRVVGVHGNCDPKAIEEFLGQEQLSLHGCCRVVNEHAFVGVGGSLPCPGSTPNEIGETGFESILAQAMHENSDLARPLILVSHQPAHGTKLDRISQGRFSGSQAIRRFIEQYQPVLAISGHIHEARGIDYIGSCTLVNPGPFRQGHFAVVDLKDGQVRVELKHLS
jgi:uncharacterized protein